MNTKIYTLLLCFTLSIGCVKVKNSETNEANNNKTTAIDIPLEEEVIGNWTRVPDDVAPSRYDVKDKPINLVIRKKGNILQMYNPNLSNIEDRHHYISDGKILKLYYWKDGISKDNFFNSTQMGVSLSFDQYGNLVKREISGILGMISLSEEEVEEEMLKPENITIYKRLPL